MRALGAAALLFLAAASLPALTVVPPVSDPAAVGRWLTEGGARREGSAGERRVFEALRQWFSSRADLEEQGFDRREGEHSFSRQLWFRIPGTRPGDLVVAVPTDGTNDRGLAWAAAWADRALRSVPPVTLVFLFTGAERGLGDAAGLGSKVFLENYYPADPAAVVYIDAPAGGPEVRITAESGLFPSPLWMVQGLTRALDEEGLGARLTGTAPSLFRFDLPGRRNALAPWFDRSVPGLLVASGPEGTGPVLALERFASALASGVPSAWDRHYLLFDLFGWKVFWGQGFYLGVFVSASALLLFGYASLGRRARGSLRILRTGLWQIPVLLALGFLALWCSTLLVNALQTARGDPELWRRAPLLAAGLKAVVTVAVYLTVLLPYRRSPFSRDPDFYGQAALVWLAFTTMGAAAVELSFSFYFLWALVWGAVMVSVPWRPVKTLALAAGPFWLFRAAFDVLGPAPDLDLAQWVVSSPLEGNFVMAVLFFPFLLQMNAWHLAGRRHQDRNEGLRAGLQITGWALGAVALALVLLRWTPAAEAVRTPQVTVVDRTAGDPAQGLWSASVSREAFLSRTVWKVVFTGSVDPEQVDLELVSSDPLLVYDCSFPVVLDPDGLRARIVVGRQPDLPLSLNITLPDHTRAALEVRAQIDGDRRYLIHDRVDLVP